MNRKGGKQVQRASRTMRGFVALIALAGAMSLLGCSEKVEQTMADDLNNQSFTFPSGAVFNPGLANLFEPRGVICATAHPIEILRKERMICVW